VITRTDATESGTELVGTLEFGSSISTNVVTQADAERVEYAASTRDGVIHLFPPG